MPTFRAGKVTRVLEERRGLQKIEVDGAPAYVLTELIGPVAAGDDVVMNTTAVDLGLGTGGWHFVHWNLRRDSWEHRGAGHIMKLRYTSLQSDTGAAEEALPASASLPDLDGMPVVACALHSQVAAVAAAFAADAPGARLVYLMTDGAALPIAISDLVAALVERGLVAATVTAGQAFGGDYEAITIHSGLQVARAIAGADAVVAGIGPGMVGTGSALGHTGLDVVEVVHAAAALNANPIVAVRYSDVDVRDRHRGVSHHTRTALALISVPVVAPEPDESTPDAVGLLAAAGISVTTMGRAPDEDANFFGYAAAAGAAAARRLVR